MCNLQTGVCGGSVLTFSLISHGHTAFLPPVMYPQSPTTVVIYKDFFAVCADDNSRLHEVTYEWVGPGDFDYYKWRILQIINVVEEDAGLYTCTATSTATGEFASASITLIVQSELMN